MRKLLQYGYQLVNADLLICDGYVGDSPVNSLEMRISAVWSVRLKPESLMKRQNHPPAYVLEIKRRWRIVVPIRGKLTPKIHAAEFASRASAQAWLRSEDGQHTVDAYQGKSAPASFRSVAVTPSVDFCETNREWS